MSKYNQINPVRCAVRRALLAGTIAALASQAPLALAQQAGDADSLEEIVVTGSRLIRKDFVAISPITTVSNEQIAYSGNVTLEETINLYPQLNPDVTSATNQSGGSGVLAPDLRGLGAVRTLLLVDGKRFIPASENGLSDMAAIPDMLIERVEIITGGASAVYGSDAIGGAINFILKDDFEGIDLRYQFGESSEGDDRSNKIDFLFGVNAPDQRGNMTLHASYTDRTPVFMEDRAFSIQPFIADAPGDLQLFGSGNIPGGKIFIPSSDFALINGVDLVGAAMTCTEGGGIQGIRFGEDSQPFPFCRPTEQFNYAPTNFIYRPFERWQFTATGHYDLSDSVTGYAQLFYTHKENEWQQAFLASSPTSAGSPSGELVIPNADTNPLFPAPLRQFFADNASYFDPDGDGTFVTVGNGRRFVEFGPRNAHYLQNSFGITSGFRGDIELFDTSWSWDAFYQFQRSDIDLSRVGLLSRSRITLGLDVVVVNGEPQCRVQLLNCVPVNTYGTNTLTTEMADFLTVTTGRADNFKRDLFGASVTGDLFDLPAGPVSTAFGLEWREEFYRTEPDEISASGDLGGTPPQPASGRYNVAELFAEARAPIVESLAVEGAVRYSDYSTIGGVTTWRAGLDWQPTDWLRGRASVSRAIRAANLNELFAPASGGGLTGGIDHCLARNSPTQAIKDLCVQQGVPTNLVDDLQVGASEGWSAFGGGNPNLNEEESDAITVGVILTPTFAEGLTIAIDYWNIEIDEAISQVSTQTLIDSCFTTLDNSTPECQAIVRDSLGNIDFVNAPLLNIQTREVDGVDLQVDYSFDLPAGMAIGGGGATLSLQWVSTWQFSDETVFVAGLSPVDCAGLMGGTCSGNFIRATPDFRGLISAVYGSGDLRIRTDVQLIGEFGLAPDAHTNTQFPIDEVFYWDLGANWYINNRFEVFAGIDNVLDEQPPLIGFRAGGDSNTQAQLYDTVGRRFFIGTTVSFGQQ